MIYNANTDLEMMIKQLETTLYKKLYAFVGTEVNSIMGKIKDRNANMQHYYLDLFHAISLFD